MNPYLHFLNRIGCPLSVTSGLSHGAIALLALASLRDRDWRAALDKWTPLIESREGFRK